MTENKATLEAWEILEMTRAERQDYTTPFSDDEVILMMQIYLNAYKEQLLNAN